MTPSLLYTYAVSLSILCKIKDELDHLHFNLCPKRRTLISAVLENIYRRWHLKVPI